MTSKKKEKSLCMAWIDKTKVLAIKIKLMRRQNRILPHPWVDRIFSSFLWNHSLDGINIGASNFSSSFFTRSITHISNLIPDQLLLLLIIRKKKKKNTSKRNWLFTGKVHCSPFNRGMGSHLPNNWSIYNNKQQLFDLTCMVGFNFSTFRGLSIRALSTWNINGGRGLYES